MYIWYLQVGFLDVSLKVSTSDAAIRLARLRASTKVRRSHSAPILLLLDLHRQHRYFLPHRLTYLSPAHIPEQLSSPPLLPPQSQQIDSGFNGGCKSETVCPMLESVSTKGEVTFSGTKSDFLQEMTWLLHG